MTTKRFTRWWQEQRPETASGRVRLTGALLALVVMAGLAWPLLASNGLIVRYCLHDMHIVFDVLWRSTIGDVAHRDYYSPIGQAYFWPLMLLGRLGDHDALAVIHAYVLVGVALTAAMAILLPRRLTPVEIGVVALVTLAMAITPRDSWLAPYNRWSWAIWMLVAQTVLIRPRAGWERLDGFVLGLLAIAIFYTKLNFFAGGAALVLFAMATRSLSLRSGFTAIATLIAGMLLVELTWHNNLGYLRDIQLALTAGAEGHYKPRWHKLAVLLPSGALYFSLILLLYWLARPAPSVDQWLRFWRWPITISAVVMVVGMAVSLQNFPNFEYAHIAIAALIAWQMARRQCAAPGAPLPLLPISRDKLAVLAAIGFVAVMAFIQFRPVRDVRQFAVHAINTRNGEACRIPELAGTQAADLMAPAYEFDGLPEGSTGPRCADLGSSQRHPDVNGDLDAFYLAKFQRTLQLVRPLMRPGDVVMNLDFSNPYPFLMRTRAPHGALIWMDMGRSYGTGAAAHPPAGPILRSSNLVIQPKLSSMRDVDHAGFAWSVYGPDVTRQFHVVGENETARLWRRND